MKAFNEYLIILSAFCPSLWEIRIHKKTERQKFEENKISLNDLLFTCACNGVCKYYTVYMCGTEEDKTSYWTDSKILVRIKIV